MKVSAANLAGAAALSLLLAPAPVRAAAPAGRYTALGGVVKDNKTGLNWQQASAPMKYTFADAAAYCKNNVAALPGSGWRLPAIKELQTLVDDSVASPGPTIDASAFPATPAEAFWSSTPSAQPPTSEAWFVIFSEGGMGTLDMTVTLSVRCVR